MYIKYMHNINIHNPYIYKISCCLHFCCFTAPVTMLNNDNTPI